MLRHVERAQRLTVSSDTAHRRRWRGALLCSLAVHSVLLWAMDTAPLPIPDPKEGRRVIVERLPTPERAPPPRLGETTRSTGKRTSTSGALAQHMDVDPAQRSSITRIVTDRNGSSAADPAPAPTRGAEQRRTESVETSRAKPSAEQRRRAAEVRTAPLPDPRDGVSEAEMEREAEPQTSPITDATAPAEPTRLSPQERERLRRVARGEEPAPEEPAPEWLAFAAVSQATDPSPDTESNVIGAHALTAPQRARPAVTDSQEGPRLDGVVSVSRGSPSPVRADPAETPRQASGSPEHQREREREHDVADKPVGGSVAGDGESPGLEERTPGAVVLARTEVAQIAQNEPDGPSTSVAAKSWIAPWGTDGWAPWVQRLRGGRPGGQTRTASAPTRAPGSPHEQPAGSVEVDATTPGQPREARHHGPRHTRQPDEATGTLRPEQLTEPFAPARSTVAAFDEASDTDRVQLTVSANELGRWAHEVDTLIRDAFATSDPVDAAFGWTGQATVEFSVSRSGRVDEVSVVQSSGIASFDALARLAVPLQLPRPPNGAVKRRITFKQR
ncbi:MAG: TonB family protein [Myxococcales bacterium]|nr:TonB family protein [Myxococcales bacterium]